MKRYVFAGSLLGYALTATAALAGWAPPCWVAVGLGVLLATGSVGPFYLATR